MDKPTSHAHQPALATSSSTPESTANAPTLPHQLLCIDALAYNWLITASTARVDLYPITAMNCDWPLELQQPIVAFAGPRAMEVPPIEGLLINAVLRRMRPEHSFTLVSARHVNESAQGVESQIRRIPDFSQLEIQDQLDLFAGSELILSGLSRSALQTYIGLYCQYRLAAGLPFAQYGQRVGEISPLRLPSANALRDALLRGRQESGLFGDLTDSDSL